MRYIYGLFIKDYVYVGNTKDVTMRQYQHITALQAGNHYNKYLQNAYEGQSKMTILEKSDDVPIVGREQFWIEKLYLEGWKILNINRAASSTKTTRKKRAHQSFTPLLAIRKKRKNSP